MNPMSWLKSILPDVTPAIGRLPVPLAIAVGLTLVLMLWPWLGPFEYVELYGQLTWGGTAAFLAAVAATVAGEVRGWTDGWRHGAAAAAAAIAVAIVAFAAPLELFQPFLFGGLALLVGLSAHAGRDRDDDGFWQFIHDLCLAAGVAVLSAGILCAALWAIIASLHYLFGLQIPTVAYSDTSIVSWVLVMPAVWLLLLPHAPAPSDRAAAPLQPHRIVAPMVQYLLTPLLLVYSAILYAYAAKIAIETSLPKGQIGYMVMGYGSMLILTVLAAYPMRAKPTPMVRFLDRAWPYLLMAPVALLIVAVTRRVEAYGFTEGRYFVVLIGVWLGLTALAAGPARVGDLRLAPSLLAGLMLLTCLGAWGARGHSIRTQITELRAVFESAGLMKAGRLVPMTPGSKVLLAADAARLNSGFQYLGSRKALDRIAEWGDDLQPNPLRDPAAKSNWYLVSNKILTGLGTSVAQPQSYFYANKPGAIPFPAGKIVGPLNLNNSSSATAQPVEIMLGDKDKLSISVDGKAIKIIDAEGKITLIDVVMDLGKNVTKPGERARDHTPLVMSARPGGRDARFIVSNGSANQIGKDTWISINGWLVWPD